MRADILTEIPSHQYKGIGIFVKIALLQLRLINKQQQVPVRVLMMVATGTGAIKIECTAFWQHTSSHLLDTLYDLQSVHENHFVSAAKIEVISDICKFSGRNLMISKVLLPGGYFCDSRGMAWRKGFRGVRHLVCHPFCYPLVSQFSRIPHPHAFPPRSSRMLSLAGRW